MYIQIYLSSKLTMTQYFWEVSRELVCLPEDHKHAPCPPPGEVMQCWTDDEMLENSSTYYKLLRPPISTCNAKQHMALIMQCFFVVLRHRNYAHTVLAR